MTYLISMLQFFHGCLKEVCQEPSRIHIFLVLYRHLLLIVRLRRYLLNKNFYFLTCLVCAEKLNLLSKWLHTLHHLEQNHQLIFLHQHNCQLLFDQSLHIFHKLLLNFQVLIARLLFLDLILFLEELSLIHI